MSQLGFHSLVRPTTLTLVACWNMDQTTIGTEIGHHGPPYIAWSEARFPLDAPRAKIEPSKWLDTQRLPVESPNRPAGIV